MKDQCNDLRVVNVLKPATYDDATDFTGADVDTKGFDSCTFVVSVGDDGDTLSGSVYFDVVLFESDAAAPVSSGAVVSPADILVPEDQTAALTGVDGIVVKIDAAAECPSIVKIGYRGDKRYVTAQIQPTGTHANGTPFSVVAVLGNPANKPVKA